MGKRHKGHGGMNFWKWTGVIALAIVAGSLGLYAVGKVFKIS